MALLDCHQAEVEIADYKLSRLDRLKKSGGGICVHTRSSLKTKALKRSGGHIEYRFSPTTLNIQHKKLKSFLLCAPYRPPDCPWTCLLNDFMDKCSQALVYGKEIFVMGDLNSNMLRSLPESDALNDLWQKREVYEKI